MWPSGWRAPASSSYTTSAVSPSACDTAGDEEYEPEPRDTMPDEPRRFRNPELRSQARVENESRAEKRAPAPEPARGCGSGPRPPPAAR